jgi:hypothetical protein
VDSKVILAKALKVLHGRALASVELGSVSMTHVLTISALKFNGFKQTRRKQSVYLKQP